MSPQETNRIHAARARRAKIAAVALYQALQRGVDIGHSANRSEAFMVKDQVADFAAIRIQKPNGSFSAQITRQGYSKKQFSQQS